MVNTRDVPPALEHAFESNLEAFTVIALYCRYAPYFKSVVVDQLSEISSSLNGYDISVCAICVDPCSIYII